MKITKNYIKELVLEVLQTEARIYTPDEIRTNISNRYLKSFDDMLRNNKPQFDALVKAASEAAALKPDLRDPSAFVAGWVQGNLKAS